jgi:FkbM family methyltransferase
MLKDLNKRSLAAIFLFLVVVYVYYQIQTGDFKLKYFETRHAFFDLGTNNGDSVMYFIKTDGKPEGLRNYGLMSRKLWDVYMVEANPFFNKSLEKTKEECEALGHTVHLYKQTAAWTRNEQLVFYLDTVNPSVNYWGSSIYRGGNDVIKSNFTKVRVHAIDVAQLLKRYSVEDEIVVKIDIEGAEFRLLEHFMAQDVLKLVDIIAIEFHWKVVDFPTADIYSQYQAAVKKYNISVVPWY